MFLVALYSLHQTETRCRCVAEGRFFRSGRPGKNSYRNIINQKIDVRPRRCLAIRQKTATGRAWHQDDHGLTNNVRPPFKAKKTPSPARPLTNFPDSTEHKQQAQKREADLQAAERLQANDALSQPAKITGINYLEINVNGPGFERGLLWQLSTWNIT
jgi:hypothetical protein